MELLHPKEQPPGYALPTRYHPRRSARSYLQGSGNRGRRGGIRRREEDVGRGRRGDDVTGPQESAIARTRGAPRGSRRASNASMLPAGRAITRGIRHTGRSRTAGARSMRDPLPTAGERRLRSSEEEKPGSPLKRGAVQRRRRRRVRRRRGERRTHSRRVENARRTGRQRTGVHCRSTAQERNLTPSYRT